MIRSRTRSLVALGALAFAPVLRAQTCTFTIAHNGTPANAQAAIAQAASIWGTILSSPVPVKFTVNWLNLFGATLGVTLPNGERDFAGAPEASTWYATSLANSIAGSELNPGEADFNIWFDAGANWYYGLDADPGPGQYDLVTVALHEMGHGLGFVGLAKKEGANGSLGALIAADFSPLITDFPWPMLDSLPSIFDRFLADGLAGPFILLVNGSTALGTAMTSGNVRFNGALVMAANGGTAPPIYAPSTFALGSSCVHFNEASFPVGDPDELMTPFASAGNANHWPGPLCIALLQDIGWTIAPNLSIAEPISVPSLTVWPNPARDRFSIAGAPAGAVITLVDVTGRTVTTTRGNELDITSFAPGSYTVVATGNGTRSSARFIKQ